jgi:DNA invertase Pin-like site-specific DNA recombinase
MDWTSVSDESLEIELNAILNEQERRQNLARIPAQIEALKQKFTEGGGDPALIGGA